MIKTISELTSHFHKFSKKSNSSLKHVIRGAFLLFLLCIVSGSFYIVGRDLFMHENPSIISTTLSESDPSKITISLDTFDIAFGLEDGDTSSYFKDERYFTVTGNIFRKTVVYINGVQNILIDREPLVIENCNENHFVGFEDATKNVLFKNAYCLSDVNKSALYMQGRWESNEFQVIQVKFNKCNNSTSKVVCATNEEIRNKINRAFFSTLYTDSSVDHKNYRNPFQKMLQGKYTVVNVDYQKIYEYYISPLEVKTDSGWLLEDSEKVSSYHLDSINELTKDQGTDNFLYFGIRASNYKTTYYRSYIKIPAVLANMSGLISFILAISMILIIPYMRIKYYEDVANKIFDLNDIKMSSETNININNCLSLPTCAQENFNTEKNEELRSSERRLSSQMDDYNEMKEAIELRLTSPKASILVNKFDEILTYENDNKNQDVQLRTASNKYKQQIPDLKEKLRDLQKNNNENKDFHFDVKKISEKLTKNEKISIGYFEYMTSFFYQTRRSKLKFRKLNYAIRNIQNSLDSANLLASLEEINKLKSLLLNKEEISLLSFLPKPAVEANYLYIEDESIPSSLKLLKYPWKFMKDSSIKIFEDYLYKITRNYNRTKIEERFIEIFEAI